MQFIQFEIVVVHVCKLNNLYGLLQSHKISIRKKVSFQLCIIRRKEKINVRFCLILNNFDDIMV